MLSAQLSMCRATVILFPQSVDEGLSEVVVCGGPTMFEVTGIEKLIKLSKSERSPMCTCRPLKRGPKLSLLLEDDVDDGGARCTKCRHFPLTSKMKFSQNAGLK